MYFKLSYFSGVFILKNIKHIPEIVKINEDNSDNIDSIIDKFLNIFYDIADKTNNKQFKDFIKFLLAVGNPAFQSREETVLESL